MPVVCLPLLILVLNGVLSDMAKARLVFWKWENPLPGCRAFSLSIFKDPRIDVERLTAKIGRLPIEANEQNVTWYRLYMAHSNEQMVLESHRSYLLTRDMTALAALLGVSFSVASFLSHVDWKLAGLYSLLLVAQYATVAISAQNYGHRFVANVLSVESHA